MRLVAKNLMMLRSFTILWHIPSSINEKNSFEDLKTDYKADK